MADGPLKLEGYVFPLSAYPGEVVTFYLGDRTLEEDISIRLELTRFKPSRSELLSYVWAPDSLPGKPLSERRDVVLHNDPERIRAAYDQGCGWTAAYAYTVEDLPSGLYLMQAARINKITGEATGEGTYLPFVVKKRIGADQPPAPILIIFPTSTSLAYNAWPRAQGGRSLYTEVPGPALWHRVHIERPDQFGETPQLGGEFIAHEYDPLLYFLREHNLDADFGVSWDLHADPAYLDAHTLYLSIGHDEYWSREMRDNVEAFIANGGNAAFLSGNSVWWSVRFYEDAETAEAVFPMSPAQNGFGRLMVCHKEAFDPIEDAQGENPADPTRATHNWHNAPLNRPGNNLTGLSSRRGATCNGRPFPTIYFQANYPAHWIYNGVDLVFTDGRIGLPPSGQPPDPQADDKGLVQIVGYETDALDEDSPHSCVLFAFTADLVPLPSLNHEEQERNGQPQEPTFIPLGTDTEAFAHIVMFRRHGTVFSVGSIGWIDGLNPVNGVPQQPENFNPGSPAVAAITLNVLQRLSARNPAGMAIANSGFERWDPDGTPSLWTVQGGTGGAGKVHRQPKLQSASRNASFSAQLDAIEGPVTLVSSSSPAQPGVWYRITAWVKTTAPSSQWGLDLVGYAGEVQKQPFITANRHSGSGEWEILSAVGSAPEGLDQVRLHVRCAPGNRVEIDDVLLEDLDQLNAVGTSPQRLNGQYTRGVPLQNADFEGDWSEGVPSGWEGSNSTQGPGIRGSWSLTLDGRAGPANATQRLGPIEWRSHYRIGMWARSDQPEGAVARLYRLSDEDPSIREELIVEVLSHATDSWEYIWDLGFLPDGPQVFWAVLELSAAPGAEASFDNVSIDVVGTVDDQGALT